MICPRSSQFVDSLRQDTDLTVLWVSTVKSNVRPTVSTSPSPRRSVRLHAVTVSRPSSRGRRASKDEEPRGGRPRRAARRACSGIASCTRSMENKASKAKTAAHDADAAGEEPAPRSSTARPANEGEDDTTPDAAVMHEADPGRRGRSDVPAQHDTLLAVVGRDLAVGRRPRFRPCREISRRSTCRSQSRARRIRSQTFLTGLGGLKRLFVVDNVSIAPGGSTAGAGAAPDQGTPGKAFLGDTVTACRSPDGSSARPAQSPPAAGSTATGSTGTATDSGLVSGRGRRGLAARSIEQLREQLTPRGLP